VPHGCHKGKGTRHRFPHLLIYLRNYVPGTFSDDDPAGSFAAPSVYMGMGATFRIGASSGAMGATLVDVFIRGAAPKPALNF